MISTQNFRRLLAAALLFSMSLTLVAQDAAPADAKFEIPATDDGLPGAGPIRRYDWFRNLWRSRRSQWAKKVEADQGAVVFLGDSITQGWGDNMGGGFGDMKVANRGISGDTTRGMLLRLDEDVLSLHPKAVVMLMGTNDLEEGAEPATIAANLKLIIAALKKHNPDMPIILCEVFPSSETKRRPADKIKEINRLYKEAVHGDPQITVVDTWTLFADKEGNAKAAEFPDLLHPNKVGYAMWTAALRPIFATLGYLETEPDNFEVEPGFVSLFNGKDLTGWMFKKTPEGQKFPKGLAWPTYSEDVVFDGKTKSDDGRYEAIHDRLVVTTPAEGRRIQQLWTTKEFPSDFILKLEFRATPNADSGVFLRAPQLQCRDYPLAGPYKELKNYKPGDWNEMVVTVKDNVAHCTCNGEVLEEALKLPETGPIGLEGDRGQMEYRRIRVKELK
ncbi:GDSL-type esterase/lipase family protein [Blastopirellula sp. JC732]|uniref:GDSL-type esterase/lipase family protein n=1 Tax=Blastopirellula sediminis TaxID=2894196 RepID=A0A9X1MKN8_9BACT|nr:GDSL-type esterase/lipase family protein [Blastopirellula sediminis]MCC9607948.1 GDSL-type esterase/lipase family protein [Blastopirellula sediminis]MCC9627259.1 GDSL-type esterase/lipase family protein [Blastopirellula sediminis]